MDQQVMQIKMQALQLQNEAKKILKECVKERTLAKNDLKRGNRATATLHAQNAVRYEQQAKQILQNAAALNGYASDMQQAQTQAKMSQTMDQAAKEMQKNAKQTNLNQLSANRTKMDGLKQNMGAAHNLLTQGDGDMDLQANADDLLSNLEDEVTFDAMSAQPAIPQGQPIQNMPNLQTPQAYPTIPGQPMPST